MKIVRLKKRLLSQRRSKSLRMMALIILGCMTMGVQSVQLPVNASDELGKHTSEEIDVASVYNGAFSVGVDETSVLEATRLLSGIKNHGDHLIFFNHPEGRTDFVVELAAPATVERLRLIGPVNENLAPKRIEVAVGGAASGDFEQIGATEFELIRDKDLYNNAFDVSIPVSVKRSGKFLRFRMSGSLLGDPGQRAHAFASLQALGHFNEVPALPDVQGVYHFQGDFGHDSSGGFYAILHQKEGWVEGCTVSTSLPERPIRPERILNLLTGGIQNAVLHLERSDVDGRDRVVGMMSFSSDGRFAHSAFFDKGEDPSLFGSVKRAMGERIDVNPIACATVQQPEQTTEKVWEEVLESEGVLQLYGINFDLDSDVLRPESFPVLDKVVTVAKARPEWRFEVGGHTDSSGTAAYNQDLSQRRAVSVVKYLTQSGVEVSRFTPKGYGEDKPMASNDTAAGMAQNRRVELVRQ